MKLHLYYLFATFVLCSSTVLQKSSAEEALPRHKRRLRTRINIMESMTSFSFRYDSGQYNGDDVVQVGQNLVNSFSFRFDDQQGIPVFKEGEPNILFQGRFVIRDFEVYRFLASNSDGKPYAEIFGSKRECTAITLHRRLEYPNDPIYSIQFQNLRYLSLEDSRTFTSKDMTANELTGKELFKITGLSDGRGFVQNLRYGAYLYIKEPNKDLFEGPLFARYQREVEKMRYLELVFEDITDEKLPLDETCTPIPGGLEDEVPYYGYYGYENSFSFPYEVASE